VIAGLIILAKSIDPEDPDQDDDGLTTADELFISADAAAAGYVVENTGPGPLVSLRYFGPDVHPDLPTNGRKA
jgi:hypothetical protein